MKTSFKLYLFALVLAFLMPLNSYAYSFSCFGSKFIDLRGNSDIDGSLGDGQDGKVTIAEVAVANPLDNLGTLVTAVTAADPLVLDALSNPDAKLTVFAPIDDAFSAIPGPILNEYLANQDLLTELLLFHVVDGYFNPTKVFYIRAVRSLQGQKLFVKRGRKYPTVNQSKIECSGVRTDNGLVWLINSVLLNQFIIE